MQSPMLQGSFEGEQSDCIVHSPPELDEAAAPPVPEAELVPQFSQVHPGCVAQLVTGTAEQLVAVPLHVAPDTVQPSAVAHLATSRDWQAVATPVHLPVGPVSSPPAPLSGGVVASFPAAHAPKA